MTFYPRRCYECGMSYEIGYWEVCPRCESYMDRLDVRTHVHLTEPEEIYVAMRYNRWARTWLHQYKFSGETKWAKFFAKLLEDSLYELDLHERFDLIVPVPLHRKRLHQRGYNQMVLIGKLLAKRMKKDCVEALEKTRHTAAQADLSAAMRLENVTNTFRAVTDLSARRILLIDDVITSGSTMCECSKALKIAGAQDVIGMALLTGHQ